MVTLYATLNMNEHLHLELNVCPKDNRFPYKVLCLMERV